MSDDARDVFIPYAHTAADWVHIREQTRGFSTWVLDSQTMRRPE
jgi:hypothetical protein